MTTETNPIAEAIRALEAVMTELRAIGAHGKVYQDAYYALAAAKAYSPTTDEAMVEAVARAVLAGDVALWPGRKMSFEELAPEFQEYDRRTARFVLAAVATMMGLKP
jgi:hypothetical protein